MSTRKPVSLRLVGPFMVLIRDDVARTPSGAKNQAILALLALSPGMSRPRRWIEDKLWSTFAPEQSGANMRQALTKLRNALGEHADALISDRNSVALDPDKVAVDVTDHALRIDEGRELLEGLDVRDPEFEEWLREERARYQARLDAARPALATGLLIRCTTADHGSGKLKFIGEVLANQIGESIAEQVRAWRQSGRHLDAGSDDRGDLEISCDITDVGESLDGMVGENGGSMVFIKVVHVPTGRILYSKLKEVRNPQQVLTSQHEVAAIVFEAADRALGKLPLTVENARPEARATALSRLALYRMFSFEPDALREADSLLSQAHDVDQNGIYTAWRSLIRTIQMIELLEPNPEALRDETLFFNQRALEEGADNALVQALISQVRVMMLGDAAGGLDLAEQSVERNPTSGFGWLSLSVSRMLAGDQIEAIAMSQRARDIARFSPFRQWWDLYHCIVCIGCNQSAAAIEAGEAAARQAPSFRPAHRHLLALYAMDGQLDKARTVADKLIKIEPGFSLDRFLNDDSYPVRTLRNKGMLEPIRALL
ncbi:transcriptional regulator [Puniceibacterium sp. IMCC21224]|uniref:transcriptional regulator n=1 Tax=Puniceibacterium sp. IMCC21224 TaxID=1618204 RepID=UPI00065D9D13|nr:transcriptional regulator [Puniceibacterium sp. IMCC21224]KMK65760.1 hypothetical protein IMCC21224_11595 [Puniceibacterium sp. IMCC21224]